MRASTKSIRKLWRNEILKDINKTNKRKIMRTLRKSHQLKGWKILKKTKTCINIKNQQKRNSK